MPSAGLLLIGATAVMQAAVAVMAVRLAREGQVRWPWLLVSAAVSVSAVRRVADLVANLGDPSVLSPGYEALGFAISLLALGGMAGLAPTFQRFLATHERLQAALDQAGEGIVLVEPEGRIQYANPAFGRMMGLAAGEIAVGRSIAEFAFGPADESLLADMRRSLARGDTWNGRYESVWRDGSRHVRDASVSPVRGTAGSLEHVVGVLRDVTREAGLERDLLHAQKLEAVGRLAAGVAHDFNNLLTVIAGYASSLVKELPAGSESHEAAGQIAAAAERAATLTRQLLTFGRKAPSETMPFDLGALVAQMSGMLGRLIGEDVGIELRLAPGIGWIDADPGQIEQAVLNLAANARDAMPGGGRLTIETREVEVGSGGEPGIAPGRWVVLSLSDTGAGMDGETLGRAFDPFFTTKEPGRGTGLGLSAVYGIVRAANGVVRARSAPEQGSTFELWFRRSEPGHTASASPRAPLPAEGGGGQTILLVEDEPLVRRMARRALERRGYRVLAARDPLEAIALVEDSECAPDLLLTDVVMPHMSGLELAERLRARRPDLKVVAMSGYAEGVAGSATGSNARFLPKPFAPDDLVRAVRAELGA